MDSYQQSEPGQFPLKDGNVDGSSALSNTTPLKDQPQLSQTTPSLRYEDFTPTVVTDGREVRLEVSSTTSSLDDIYSLGRSIKALSFIEMVYIIAVFCFWSKRWSLLLLLWGPVAGVAAGAHFNLLAAKCYAAFFILKIIFFSIVAITGNNVWWGICSVVVNACLLRYVWLFRTMLDSLGEIELDHLRAAPGIRRNTTQKKFYFFKLWF